MRLLAGQAQICADHCLDMSQKALMDNANQDEIFSDKETECIENCTLKLFNTEQLLMDYLPQRLIAGGPLDENTIS